MRLRRRVQHAVPFLKQIVLELETIGQQLEAFWRGVDNAMPPPLSDKSLPQSQLPDRRLDHIAQKLGPRRRPSPTKAQVARLKARIFFGRMKARVSTIFK